MTTLTFSRKRAVNASLQPPYSDYGVATELTWRSIAYLAVLFSDSLRSHGAFTAFTLQALRFHGVCTALSRPWRVEGAVASQSKEEGKDQESMQLSTTPDQDTVGESDKKQKKTLQTGEPRGLPFPTVTKDKKKKKIHKRSTALEWAVRNLLEDLNNCVSRS